MWYSKSLLLACHCIQIFKLENMLLLRHSQFVSLLCGMQSPLWEFQGPSPLPQFCKTTSPSSLSHCWLASAWPPTLFFCALFCFVCQRNCEANKKMVDLMNILILTSLSQRAGTAGKRHSLHPALRSQLGHRKTMSISLPPHQITPSHSE